MSYLDFPRIHFSGRFEAGPSTVNNTPSNYELQNPDKLIPGWAKDGNGCFKLLGCTVSSTVTDASGPSISSALVGSPVASTDNWGGSRVPAKIVDLDPEQQQVSMIYGLQLKIGEGDDYVIAEMAPMWFQNFEGSATYVSVLKPIDDGWGTGLSGVLATLHENSRDLLSIKFMIGPISGLPNDAPVVAGIVGTIGPAKPSDPINFVAARRLSPPNSRVNRGVNWSPAMLTLGADKRPERLTMDLGSGIANGSNLSVKVIDPKHGPISIGTIEFTQQAYRETALIVDFDLSTNPNASRVLPNAQLVVYEGSEEVLAEDPSGLYIDADPYVLRMEADSTAVVNFWVTRFGLPADNVEIDIFQQPGLLPGGLPLLPRGLPRSPPPPTVGKPGPGGTGVSIDGTELTVSSGVATITSRNGRASATISGGNPMKAREFIEGQVYGLFFQSREQDQDLLDPNAFLSLLVHEEFAEPHTWESIQPIMAQYAQLYPVMKNMGIDLGSKSSLEQHKPALLRVFSRSFDDPSYMPVVRDLSEARQAAIVGWLESVD